MSQRIGIDLGTSNIRIYLQRKGVLVNEPNVVALNVTGQNVVDVGTDAKKMLGRTPDGLIASYPLNDGVIASYKNTKQMLQIYLGRILGRIRIFKPEIIVNVPIGATSTEKKAILDVMESVGAKKVYLVKSPLSAALGAGIDIFSSSGNMIIDVGGGKTEVAVISLGDIVAFSSVRYGGKKFDSAISDFIRKNHSLIIGEQTAEFAKTEIGSVIPQKKSSKYEISGSNTVTGLPESIFIETSDIIAAIRPVLNEIILAVKQVLQKTPPELSSDVMDKGIVIAGGASMLRGFDELLTKVTGVPCQMAEDPERCSIAGIGTIIESFQAYKEVLQWKVN